MPNSLDFETFRKSEKLYTAVLFLTFRQLSFDEWNNRVEPSNSFNYFKIVSILIKISMCILHSTTYTLSFSSHHNQSSKRFERGRVALSHCVQYTIIQSKGWLCALILYFINTTISSSFHQKRVTFRLSRYVGEIKAVVALYIYLPWLD